MTATRVLVVDDNPEDRRTYRGYLAGATDETYEVKEVECLGDARGVIAEWRPACVVLEYRLPDGDGTELLSELVEEHGRLPSAFVMLTGQGDEEVAVNAMKHGARDYLNKNRTTSTALLRSIRNAVRQDTLERDLERAVENIREFAATAAHDLKSPLRRIAHNVKVLDQSAGPRLRPEERRRLAKLTAQAERMQALIDGILEFASTRRDCSVRSPVDLRRVLGEALANLAREIEASEAEIVSGDLPTVKGAEAPLIQLLQNVVANAIKFSAPDPPRIAVEAGEQGEEHWLIRVRDHGPGIARDDLERIFQPLKRCHDGGFAGYGLGLATCRRIVESLGGRIWAESDLGKGTTVCFTLQRADAASKPGHRQLRVLIVDDDPDDLELTEEVLEPLFRTRSARSAKEAIEALDAEAFDVIVSDYRMPRCDGLRLLSKVKETHPDVVRVLMSSHAPDQLDHYIESSLISHFATKIISANPLVEHLDRAIRPAASRPASPTCSGPARHRDR